MNLVSKIACRTIGTAGMGIALYEASRTSSYFAKTGKNAAQANYLYNAYYNARTLDDVSYTSNNIQEKTFDVRTRLHLPAIIGQIKGGIGGFLYGLGNSLPIIGCSALALVCKNWLAKAGAIGIALGFCYKIARNGFGLGKQNPMT